MGEVAGKRVRDWRLTQQPAMNQAEFARAAKVSLGCLQAFEKGIRTTRDKNVTKIAAVIGLTKEQLLSYDWPQQNPLAKDLRFEDYTLANRFHHDAADVKHAIKLFFEAEDEIRERIARIVEALVQSPHLIASMKTFLDEFTKQEHPAEPPVVSSSKRSKL